MDRDAAVVASADGAEARTVYSVVAAYTTESHRHLQ